jgi:rod shape-determining protein MreC
VGVRLDGSQQLGVAHGSGSDVSLALFDPYAATRAGDRVVTFGGTDISGSAGTYVGGLPLGTVTAVHGALGSLDRTATVRPYVDPTTLDLVGVLLTTPRETPRGPVAPEEAGS